MPYQQTRFVIILQRASPQHSAIFGDSGGKANDLKIIAFVSVDQNPQALTLGIFSRVTKKMGMLHAILWRVQSQ